MSKQAVIEVSGVQHLVSKGDKLTVDRQSKDKLEFQPLMIVEGDKSVVGTPYVEGAKVTAKKLEDSQGDKVTSIRFKAKKRVDTKRGHRQPLSTIEITAIS
jgi:large subunit ribosomal protein L21